MLVQEGRDEEAAQLLDARAAAAAAAAGVAARAAARSLWMRLGECRERLRDQKGAVTAFEKALEADPSRRPLRETLLARYGDDPAHDVEVRAHRMRILEDEPLHAPVVARALAHRRAQPSARDGGRRFLELLAGVGRRQRRGAPASCRASQPRRRPSATPTGTLDEDDHLAARAPRRAGRWPSVFAAVVGRHRARPRMRARLRSSARRRTAQERVSPVERSDLARAYSLCARMLGNRKTGLYRKPDPAFVGVAVIAQPPTAIVAGARLTDGRSLADVRFILGRALEIARPEYILAAALSRHDFTRLFAAILRAFHPRHARRRAGAGAASTTRRRCGSAPCPLQGRQAAGRALPRAGGHRVLVGALAQGRAADRQSRGPPGCGRHHRRRARSSRRRRPARASSISPASPPATTTWRCATKLDGALGRR